MNPIAVISAGTAEYSVDMAKVRIDDLIESLQWAKEDGAEFIVGLSGNYRGPKYVALSAEVELEYDED